MRIIKVKKEEDVIKELCNLCESQANEVIAENKIFRVGLSGASLVKYLAHGLPTIKTDWSKWQFFFCDERFVPENDLDSTFGSYKDLLLPKIQSLSEEQFIKIDTSLSLEDCAKDYEAKIRREFNLENSKAVPEFDLLLMGMGPDGHTCSLFPGHELLDETNRLIAPISDSPKPPPQRVTMTFPLINNAKAAIFPIAGSAKAEMIKNIIGDKLDYPAGRVNPKSGNLMWIIDESALSTMA